LISLRELLNNKPSEVSSKLTHLHISPLKADIKLFFTNKHEQSECKTCLEVSISYKRGRNYPLYTRVKSYQ
jgi:hypothetical protein